MKRSSVERASSAGLVFLLLLGCAAGTSMTARVNPLFASKTYQKLFVFATFENLDLQTAIEEKLANSFKSHGVECVFESWTQFDYDARDVDQLIALIDSSGCDALLIISLAGSGTSNTYIPKSSTSTTTGSGNVDRRGNITYNSKTRTQEFGGYNVSKPWARFEAKLYDAATFEVAWRASSSTGGNAFANWKTIVRSMAGQTVSKLAEQRLIP